MNSYKSLIVVVSIVLTLPRLAAADAVQVEIGNVIVTGDTATVAVTLHTNGNVVSGIQNDILFDHRVIALANAGRCTVDPAIGFTSPGCSENPPVGLCLTLNRTLVNCGDRPTPGGCEGQPAWASRLRALMLDHLSSPARPIPDGSVLYRCVFDIVDRDALPALLKNNRQVSSDPVGNAFETIGVDGSISTDGSPPPTWPPWMVENPTPAAAGDPCQHDGECASNNCDLNFPQGNYYGTCQTIRTPTPTSIRPCLSDDDCAGAQCNGEEGLCCESATCPDGSSCAVPGHEGVCVPVATPTPTQIPPAGAVIDYGITDPDASGRFTLRARLDGAGLAGLQNDITFDERAIRLAGRAPCQLNPEISDQRAECEAFPVEFPCLVLIPNVASCADTMEGGCLGRAPHETRLRLILRQVDVNNHTTIASGVELFTCAFEVADASLLPSDMWMSNLFGESSDAQLVHLEARTTAGADELETNFLTVEAQDAPATSGGGADDGCTIVTDSSTGGSWLLLLPLLTGLFCRRINKQP